MAFIKSYLMQVDIKQRMSSPVPLFKQGETSQLLFKVYDDGQLYDLSGYTRSELTFQLPDGSVVVGNGVLNVDNLIQYDFTGVEMAQVGTVKVILDIYSGVTLVSTQPFNIHIYDDMKNVDLSYIGILQDLIAEVQLLKDEVNTALNETNQLKNEMEIFFTDTEVEEDIRVANEITRISSEDVRIVNESTRQSNESGRISQENVRQNNEVVRESNEASRQNAESTRASNENTRISNEIARETEFNTKIQILDDIKSIGDFNLSTAYKKNNIVLNNSSSWIALQDTQNNPLPVLPITENTWWRLVAQRGIDGTGAVSSVNSVAPDINGNVILSANDIGAISNAEKGVANGIALLNADGKVVDATGNLVEGKVTSVNGQIGVVNLTKSDIGLSNADNTSDSDKPISIAVQTALDLKARASDLLNTDNNLTQLQTDFAQHLDKKATTTTLGHVMVDGATITVDANGVISSVGGASIELANVTNLLSTSSVTGTQITITFTNPTNTEYQKTELFVSTDDISNASYEYCSTSTSRLINDNTTTTYNYNSTVNTTYYFKAFCTHSVFGTPTVSKGTTSSCTAIDSEAPAPITNFKVDKEESQSVTLSWVNPIDSDFSKTRILYKTGSYPTSPSDGTVVVDSAITSIAVSGLINDTKYYFRAFTYDTNNNVNSDTTGQQITATPSDVKIYGVKIDATNSNPSTAVTYTDNAIGFTPASGNNGSFSYGSWQDKFPFNQIKPCVLKSDGTVNYYLNPNDYTKKIDGTNSDITSGSDGDVMVEFPTIWWKFETVGNDLYVRYADAQVDTTYKPLGHMRGTSVKDKVYISAYMGYTIGGKLRSLSDKTPTASQTIGTFRTQAQANGTGYDQMAYYQLLMLQVLFIVMFKSRDSQTALGRGYVDGNSASRTTGTANTRGLFYGETTGKQPVKFCGVEDFWGNVYYWIDGVVTDVSRNMLIGNQSFNDIGSGYINYGQGATADIGGYISKVQGGTETGFIIKEGSASNTTYYADYGYLYASRVALFGGYWGEGSSAGTFLLYLSLSASDVYSAIGSRSFYL